MPGWHADVLQDRATLIEKLTTCADLKQVGFLLAWGVKAGLIFTANRAGPSQPQPGKTRLGLFPLPVSLPGIFSNQAWHQPFEVPLDLACEAWAAVSCAALNNFYGCAQHRLERPSGKVHREVLELIKLRVRTFLLGENPYNCTFGEVVDDLKNCRVSYTGEEIAQPLQLTREQIVASLPPLGHGGAVAALPFLQGRTRFLVENPEENLIPPSERFGTPVQAKVHIQAGHELEVFELLRERGVIRWVPESEAFRNHRGIYLAGMFGVIKANKFTPSGSPVLRVIMNLVPINAILRVVLGDISYLPSATAWLPLTLDSGDEISLSQGDMQSAFYLFSLPPQWSTFMCFNFMAKGDRLGLDPAVRYRPACCVLPMGWNSSVGIMQQISREILLSGGLPPSAELHRGSRPPPWFIACAQQTRETRAFWQVYLDNFFSAEVADVGTAQVGLAFQRAAMLAWSQAGVLTAEDKQTLNAPEVVELGIRLDGTRGLLGASPLRLFKTLLSTLYLLQDHSWSKRTAQVVLGRWIFILQFRRAGMGILSQAWRALERPWPTWPEKMNLQKELWILCGLAPLLQTNLLNQHHPEVTCSDASEKGGACAVAKKLTWSGESFCSLQADLRLKAIDLPILVVSAFNGVGGSFRVYDVLGISPAGRISIEWDRHANRTSRTAWPSMQEYHDIESITKDDVAAWANSHPRIAELHFWGGFPCIHLSKVRAFRRNLQGEGSRLFWVLVQLLQWIHEVFSPFATVRFLVENVASMDESARREISAVLDVQPVKLDPADCLPFNRPRLAWCSAPLYAMEGLELHQESDYVRAFVTTDPVQQHQWIRPGWAWDDHEGCNRFPTFMKSIPRNQPPPFPAGLQKCDEDTVWRWQQHNMRYPPYQYAAKYLLFNPEAPPRVLDSSEREILLGHGPMHTASCMSASRMKQSLTKYEDVRCSLCGDGFSILSFAIMGAAMCAQLIPRMSPQQIVNRLGLASGSSAHPAVVAPTSRWLQYAPPTVPPPQPVHLVQQLSLTVNHTGSDVRLDTGMLLGKKPTVHASVQAMWWVWTHLFKTRWRFHSHINFLEMKMIFLTLLWKCRSFSCVNKKWVHLTDSMVSLLILAKGRTSSRLLQPLCNQIGALQLATGSTALMAHVGSADNPTDEGSRT